MSTDTAGASGLPLGEPLDTGADTTTAPHAARPVDDRLAILSVRMTIIALSFFFACFYFALFYLQLINQNGLWLPKGIDHPPTWVGVSETALMLIAGLVYFWAQWAGLYARNFRILNLGLWIAALLTVVSVIVHVIELHAPGFGLQGGGYVSVFIATEGTFTIFLVLTAIVLLGVANRARLGLFEANGVAVEAFGEYYGWLSAVALINFLALYVQPFFPISG